MMSSPIARERPGHEAEQSVEVLILSLDDELISDIEASLDGAYRVHHARSDALAIDVLAEHAVGVLVTDEAMEHAAFQKLARQLREQFPDLIIIGVGEREAASSLIEMVNNGRIYRFLLKPLSPGQVRLRVQSAAHQHLALREGGAAGRPMAEPYELPTPELAAPAAEPADAGGRSWRRPLMIGAAVAVIAAVAVALILLRGGKLAAPARTVDRPAPAAETAEPGAAPAATEVPAAGLSEVERLLDAASLALQEERYIDPVDNNALDDYLAVLDIDPENPEADAGLDAVAGAMLDRAQTALSEDRGDDALVAYGIAQEIRPEHPDLPLVEAAFADQGRLLIARMNLAVAANDWTRAREHLDLAAHFLPPDSPEIAAARALLAQRVNQVAIAERVALAGKRMDANSLTVPENDSAKFHLLALNAEYPDDPDVDAGLERLAGVMLDRADNALLEENYDAAERWLGEVEELGVEQEALSERREALAAARNPPLADAEEAPAGDATVAALNPEAEETADTAAAGEASALADGGTDAAAESTAAEPVRVASKTPAAAGPEAGAGATLDEEPVPATELEIVRMVEPEYPRRAWVRDINGWVDLEFTVTETGLTRAIEVTDAQFGGWFDRAAVEAVEQWRFAPEKLNGQPVERRAKVRLQFARE